MGYRWKWLWTGAASLSLLTGCGEDAPSIPGEPEVKTFPLVVGWSGNSLRDFDPQFAFESGSIELVNNISASLLKANLTNGLPEADLATELPEVSQDGRTYTFKLRSGIKFADGTDLTADHFVRSFARTQLDADDVLAPTSGGTLVRPYVQSVDALDPLTVRYTLVEPTSRFTSIALTTAYLPSNARFPSDALFLSPRANLPSLPFVKDALSVTDPDQLLGSGAYRIKSLEWADAIDIPGNKVLKTVQLSANPDYYGTRGHADPVTMINRTDQELYEGLLNGSVDILREITDQQILTQAKASPDLTVSEVGTGVRFLSINTEDCIDNGASPDEVTGCPLNLRKAFAKALNRDALAALFQGRAEPARSPIPRSLWSHLDTFPDRNLDEARALLAAEGYTADNKLKLVLFFFSSPEYATAIKASLEETGAIEVTARSNPQAPPNLATLGWAADYPDPASFMDAVNSIFPYPAMNAQITAASREIDYLTRQNLYEQIQRDLAEQLPYIPLTFQYRYMVTRKKIIAPIGPDERLLFHNVRMSE